MSQSYSISKASWHLKRLKKMSVKEVPYRVNHALRKRFDKYFGVSDRLEMRISNLSPTHWEQFNADSSLFGSSASLTSAQATTFIREARSITRHNFEIFGVKTDFGTPINFHLDPRTGRTWPIKFWGDIDYRDGQTVGGIKFAWELNRLNHWPKLAIAYSLTQDQKYMEEIFAQLDHWLESNRYSFGINWISGIEVGIRLVNLYYSLKLSGIKEIKHEYQKSLAKFVFQHAHHLYRYPSKHSSCGNHALAEALGLYTAGLMFSHMKHSHKWRAFGKKVLENEVTRQIHPDGSSFEHTVPYLQFVADHFLVYYLICKEHDDNISVEIERRLKSTCNFVSCIVDINGNIPMIGDDDDGYLLKLWCGAHNNFLSLLNTCSILFTMPDWIHPAASLDTKTRLLLGSAAIPRWEKLKKERSWRRKSCYFNSAGLAVIAHQKAEKEILFILNCGQLGAKPTAGHGHADALSIWLSVNGQPFFVDPGTYLYHSGGKWRRYFRSTAAHNTIQIDGKDQAEQVADFMFDKFYQIQNVYWSEQNDTIVCQGEHDGYCRLSDPVVHRREIRYLKKDYTFEIVDRLTCYGRHNVRLCFHLHPDVKIHSRESNVYSLSTGAESLLLQVDNGLDKQVFFGSEDPIMGWYSNSFNHLEKTISLVFTKNICGGAIFGSEVTIL